MSKKFKKLLSGLLALAIVASSGIAALADEPAANAADATAATETAQTAAPEGETAAPAEETTSPADMVGEPEEEPTAEPDPTEVPDKYEVDSYYKKALSLCKSLGIITGYDDGSVKPESTVTRAEMAAIILRMTAASSTSVYRNIFNDVDASHWAADTIQTAADASVINGMGDGTFKPDGEVLYEQAVKMIVCGMNYGMEAEYKGGYPEGYLSVAATNLSLLTNVKGSRGAATERGEIIKMVYNALLGPYNDVKETDEFGNFVYESTETLAKAKFNVYEEKGLLTGTNKTAITATKPVEGQITIDGETYLCDLEDLDQYVASEVTYYYIDDNKDDPRVIAVVTNTAKTTEKTLEADDIKSITDISTDSGRITTYSSKSYKLDSPYVIYNGDLIDSAVYAAAVAADKTSRFDKVDYAGESDGTKMSFEDFIIPRVGDMRLVDNDGDGKYDVIFVNSVETMLITAATDKKVIGNINKVAVTLDVDKTTNLDKVITVIKDGDEAKPKNLKKNEVVSVTRNLNNDIITLESVNNVITGKVAAFTTATDTDPGYITVNGEEYEVDPNALGDCAIGIEASFSLDKFDRVGYVESDSVITTSEKYGWILSAYTSDSGNDYIVKLFNQDGAVVEYNVADKINYWGPESTVTDSRSLSKTEFIRVMNNISYNTVGVAGGTASIRLVKYSTNSKNQISKLYVATTVKDDYEKSGSYSDTEKTYDRKALIMNTTNMTSTMSVGNMLGSKYYMSDGMLEFTVPNQDEQMNDTGNYSVQKVNASVYLNKENNIGKDCIFGEFSDSKQTYPTVVIRYVGALTNAAVNTDYGSADNNSCFMLDKILTGVDADDEVVYTLVGRQNGGEARYTTKQNTLLTKMTGPFGEGGDSGRQYVATDLWDAVDGINPNASSLYPGAKTLPDILGKGDIIGVAGGGSVLMLMVDASELADAVKSGTDLSTVNNGLYNMQNPGASSSRDNIYVGKISDSELDANAMMSVADYKVVFDPTRGMDTVLVDEAGNISISDDMSTVADVMDYNDNLGVGDFAFVRYANKGNLQEIYIFRFED